MRFGYHNASFYPDDPQPIEATVDRAKRLEDAGFEWFSCMDHLWQLPFVGEREEPFFDCYTVLPAIARETDSMELSALVTSPHYRNPAMLGRILTTLDHVSGGRAVLGIGAGWFEEEYAAYGYDFPDVSTRVSQLAETVELIEAIWTEESPVTYRGDHYEIEDLILEPKPVQEPRPDVLVGGGGEQLTLKAVADLADRWNVPGVSPDEFERKCDVLADHCETFGTDYDAIEKTVFQGAVIRETTEEAHEAYEAFQRETDAGQPTPREEYRGLVGTPGEVSAEIEAFEERGAEMVMLRAERDDPETLEYLLEEIVPDLR
ncbi:TIGR03560 family F420-dependent LLM class oxidoreductase [Halopiger aswanensis]|uniref:F420-dependent oxidoreductase-like protein n=1 Tax=Halopiger aswanensis TaxID=148449 RepID=A0A419WDB0_9EURY|nr:TIGR03560 family F420-dependent LLM class oxidoreductase [Halopiger aswanensis]RKD93447.1 F420-dependent oxidoreductase-like protein [Halopiger aswanensis]